MIQALMMGIFGLAEILETAEKPFAQMVLARMSSPVPTREDLQESVGAILRGSVIGTLLGRVPGITNSPSPFVSHVAERKASKHPERKALYSRTSFQRLALPMSDPNLIAVKAGSPFKTFEKQGDKVYNSSSRGFSVPAGTPKEIVSIAGEAIKKE